MPDDGDGRYHVPDDLPLPRYPLASKRVADAYESVAKRPTDPEGHTRPAPPEAQEEPPLTQLVPRSERRMSALITALFALSFAGSLAFCCAYVFINIHGHDLGLNLNRALGTTLGVTMLGLGIGTALIGKKFVPAVHSVQERSPHHSEADDEHAAEEELIGGMTEAGIAQRRVMRRTMLAALGVLPLPFIFGLRDLGPRPETRLRTNAWRRGDRLVDPDTGNPLKLGDLAINGFAVVMPEGATDATKPVNAESVVVVVRLPPGVNRPLPGRANWAASDHVAYSRICTHAGCPVGLYQHQHYNLVCPCHQSTFHVPDGCKVLFGPAGHPLPQLPIYVDADGYFRARAPFDVAVGPAYWERS